MKGKKRGNGEGTFYYDSKRKRWTGQMVFGFKENGKPNRISRYGKTKKECVEKLKQYELEFKTGTLIEPSKLTVHDIIKLQIDDDYDLNIIQETTKKRRMETLRIIDDNKIGVVPIQELNEFQIKNFFKGITHYSNSSINKVFNALKKCCKYAQKKKIIHDNPFDGSIIKPRSDKSDKKISALTVEEQQSFIDVLNNEEINNRYRFQFLIMLCTGMRMGEINALTIKDVNFTFNTINIDKTISKDIQDKAIVGSQTKTDAGMRMIEMTPTLKSLLLDYIDNHFVDNKEHLLFYDFEKNSCISTNQVNLSFKRLIEKYNIIPIHYELHPLSEKNKTKIAYRKYNFYKKEGNDYKLLGVIPPADWDKNFGKYYFKKKYSDKEYNQHMLRHTFATRCIENNVDYKTLSDILGHADIKVTLNTYCDVIGKFKKQQFAKIENIQKGFNIIGSTAEECNKECNRKAL